MRSLSQEVFELSHLSLGHIKEHSWVNAFNVELRKLVKRFINVRVFVNLVSKISHFKEKLPTFVRNLRVRKLYVISISSWSDKPA